MDDFEDIYQERQRVFDAGKKRGIEEASAHSIEEFTKEGRQFGS